MLYLQTKTILIELMQVKKPAPTYLLGDQEFLFLPTRVVQTAFKNANWNRALKYPVQTSLKAPWAQTNELKTSYFPLHLNLYLAFRPTRLVCLSFDQLGHQILDQTYFQSYMLPLIAKHYQKQKQAPKHLNAELLASKYLTLGDRSLQKINGFFVNATFDVNSPHYQWNFLIQLKDQTRIYFTAAHQLVYEVDQSKLSNSLVDQFQFIDWVNGLVYCQGDVQIQDQLRLNLHLNYEDGEEVKKIHQAVLKELGPLINGSSQTPFHLYNLTNDQDHLVTFLKNSAALSYFAWKKMCDDIFKELNQNYYELFYSLAQTKPYLFAKITNDQELQDLVVNLRRFGFLTAAEQEKIQTLKTQLILLK